VSNTDPIVDSEEPEPMIDVEDIKVEDPGWEEDYNPWGASTNDCNNSNDGKLTL
jgi:hypothetical protein